VKLKVPPVEGVVPLINPPLLKLRPVGSEPDTRLHVKVPNPPVAFNEAEYGAEIAAAGSDAVVMTSGLPMRMFKTCVVIAAVAAESVT
jgi:hypothetical protein